MNLKFCPRCKNQRSPSCFHKDANSSDGLHTYCKDCRNRAVSLTRKILEQVGDDPITSKEIAIILNIDPRACRSRMSLLQKRGDIVFVDYAEGETRANRTKLYVRAGSTKSLPLDTLLCHASNDWLKHA